MGAKVLVTGGTGITGGYLSRYLAEHGYTVRALDCKSSWIVDDLRKLGVEVVLGDVTDPDSVREAVKGVEVVYHLAAIYNQENVTNRQFWEANALGVKNMLEASLQADVVRFVHCSTVGVHGHVAHPPADENAPFNYTHVYTGTKLDGEKIARDFYTDHGLPISIVRPAGVYGPGDFRFLKLYRAIKNGWFVMLGNGKTLYHLVYLEDLARGFELCGTKPEALGQTYIIADNEYLTLERYVATIAEVLGAPTPRWHFPIWPVYAAGILCETVCKPLGIEPPLYRRRVDFFRQDRAFNISKAKRELGFCPKVDTRTGIKLTADWYQEKGYL